MAKRSKKDKIEYCIKCVTHFVDEIDEYFFEDDVNKKIIDSFIVNPQNIVHFSVNSSEGSKKVVVLFYYDKSNKDSIISDLGKKVKTILQEDEKDVQFIGMTERIGDKNTLSNGQRSIKSILCKTINRPVSRVNIDVFFMPKVDNKPIEINVTRMNSLIFPEPNINLNVMQDSGEGRTDEIFGYIFVVSLAELVDIYNRVGDELFSSNLRYGIADNMSLEGSMKKTLLDEPEMFWFYNNGITIVTEQDSIGLENAGKIILSECWNNSKLNFSIINGAQTISTVSRIFDDDNEDRNKINNARKNARILLRIITANSKETRRNITIALNRQKPIRPEDIAFQTNFVSEFNEYMFARERRGEDYLYIIKRGESVYDDNTIELSVFAQLVYSCLMNPTAARNNSHKSLYYKDNDPDRLNPDYFKNAFEESAPPSNKDLVFNSYYQEIMWAYKVYKTFNERLKDVKDKDSKAILSNNRWAFVSYLLKTMNNFSGKELEVDYSYFLGKADVLNNLRKYMDAFIVTVNTAYNNDYKSENSKTKVFWENILKVPQQDCFKQLGTLNPRKEEIVTKHDFEEFLLSEKGFEYDATSEEYSYDAGNGGFGAVNITIHDDTFDISAMLFDEYYDMENSDDTKGEKYQDVLCATLEEFNAKIGSEPETFDFFGCDDKSVDIGYSNEKFDKALVENFISVIKDLSDRSASKNR